MWHFIYHWGYQDLWSPVWPNWFAGGVGFLAGSLIGRKVLKKIHQHLDTNHELLKLHITKEHQKSRKHLERHLNGNQS